VRFVRYQSAPGRPAPGQITSIGEDDIGELWVGAADGLYLFDRVTGSFRRFGPDARDPKRPSHDYIRCLRRDLAGTLWIGTDGGGLNQIVRDLVAQLDGSIRVENRGGTVYSIVFPAPEGREGGGESR
jgi:hypothetical protein